MNHVIATKTIMWKLSAICLVFFLNINFCFSQITEIETSDTADINISKIKGDKINAFIFIKADNKNRKTIKLENNLDILEILEKIDFAKFNIYKFIITTHPVCPMTPPKLTLDGYEMPSKFELDPYYILVENGKAYDELSKTRLDSVSTKTIIVAPNKDSKNSRFLLFKEEMIFITLIKKSDDVTTNVMKKDIEIMKSQIHRLDSIMINNKPNWLKALFTPGEQKVKKN